MKILITELQLEHTSITNECFEIPELSEISVLFFDSSRLFPPTITEENSWKRTLADSIIIFRNKVLNQKELEFDVITDEIIESIKGMNKKSFNMLILSAYGLLSGRCNIVTEDRTAESGSIRRRTKPSTSRPMSPTRRP